MELAVDNIPICAMLVEKYNAHCRKVLEYYDDAIKKGSRVMDILAL